MRGFILALAMTLGISFNATAATPIHLPIMLEGPQIQSIHQIHKLLAERLEFPAHYAKNFDALYDMLVSLKKDTTIIIAGGRELRNLLGSFTVDQLMETLNDAADLNPNLKVEYRP